MKQLFFVLLSILTLESSGQVVRNVLATQSGNRIFITYDLNSPKPVENFRIDLLVSLNGGHNWSSPLSEVSGAVGENIKAGDNQQIIWDVLAERSDLISDNIQFKIQAQKINSSMPLNGEKGSFVDNRDGTRYNWVKVGKQIWMAENLRYDLNGHSFVNPNINEIQKNGRLYDYKGAIQACPTGWHLPNNPEWFIMLKQLGGLIAAGPKMKTSSDWLPRSGNNASGLSVRPAGMRLCTSGAYLYRGKGRRAYFWSDDDKSLGLAHTIYLRNDFDKVYHKVINKDFGLSVRCVKDRD